MSSDQWSTAFRFRKINFDSIQQSWVHWMLPHWYSNIYFTHGSKVLWSPRLCVCLSERISCEPHVRSLPFFWTCCLCPWLSPPPLWPGDKIPRRRGNFGLFLPQWKCIMQHLGPIQKRLNQSTCHFGWRLGWAQGTMAKCRCMLCVRA